MSSNEGTPITEPKPEQKSGGGGGGFLGSLASGVATAGNVAGTAASGILSTAGETVNTAAKGTGDTLQKTIGSVTGGSSGTGQQGQPPK